MRIPFVTAYKTNKKAKNIVEEAQKEYQIARNKMDDQRQITSENLEALGKTKLKIWSEDIKRFTDVYQYFKDVKIAGNIGSKETLQVSMENNQIKEMQLASTSAAEILKGGAASVGMGAIVGCASYGAVGMLGHASTGAAISALSGAAAQNATLAWFGGGAVSAGGLGMQGGALVLGGIVVVPMLIMADCIMAAKADEKLAQARKIYQEARLVIEKMDTVTDFMIHVESLSQNYLQFLQEFSKRYKILLDEVQDLVIEMSRKTGITNKISFAALSITQKKLLQITWLMTQVLYHVLKAPILTSRGNIQSQADATLESAKEITQELTYTYQTNGEISEETLDKLSLLEKRGTKWYQIKEYITSKRFMENIYVKKAGNVFLRWKVDFLHSGVLGYVSLGASICTIIQVLVRIDHLQ